MTAHLHLTEGTGILHVASPMTAPHDEPLLHGTICFDLPARWRSPVLRVRAEAWLDMTAAKLRYRLSVGGIPGCLTHRMRIAGVGPDYIGILGHDQELQVAGWRNTSDGLEGPSLTLAFYSNSLGSQLLERLLARSLGTRG
jgi:hypothetical protein